MRRGGIIRKALRAAIVLAAPLAGFAGAPGIARAEIEFSAVRVEASYTSDNNVSRGPAGEALADRIIGLRVSSGLPVPLSTRTRAVFQGFAGGEKFQTYSGLSHNFLGGQGDLQFRSAADFGAATYAAFLRTQAEYYESSLRDGYRHVIGLSLLKPLTDRIQLFAALAQNISDGKSAVFDTRSTSLRGNLDWGLSRWDTVYLGAEYRRGDSVSTASRNDPIKTLGRVNTATPNIIQDDAFTDIARDAYRLKTNILMATLGYNRSFGASQSLDVSWRRVQATAQHPVSPATSSDLSYSVNQFSLAYLARF